MSLKKRKHDVYVDRPLKPDHGETAANGFHSGPAPAKLLKDAEIEKDAYRLLLGNGEGDISILVRAGEELGEIHVAVQYEGEKGAWNQCLARQGALLSDVQKWLTEIYAAFPGEFQMDIVSEPCPKGDARALTADVVVGPGPVIGPDVTPGVDQ